MNLTMANKPYFIVDTAAHHEGDVTFLEQLINDITALDIDAVKFHLIFDLEDYFVSSHPANKVVRKFLLSKDQWRSIFEVVAQRNKKIILLCNDVASVKFAVELVDTYPIDAIELHSTGLNDVFLLREVVQFKSTLILGVGGSTFDEVQFAVDFLKKEGKTDLLLMHGFQNYPTKFEDINFNRIKLLQAAFHLPVGYADHTDPVDPLNAFLSILPFSMGVHVFEKHATHVFGQKRIDAQAAVSIHVMKEIVELGYNMFKTLGDSNLQFSPAELSYGNTGPMKKAIVARNPIKMGEKITLDNLAFKRTEVSSPLRQKDFVTVVGMEAKRDIAVDELLTFDNVAYQFTPANFDQFFINKEQ